MAMSLSYSSSDHVNRWQDEQLALCCVDCGFRGGDTQPVFSSDNIHCLMIYGEVYDYEQQKKQLAAKGHQVRSDAEFCLALYREQGETAFTTLNGSFCIVLANLKKRQLLLVTDHLSSRSFFYSQDPKGTLIFGSQVSTLLNLPNIDRELDVAAVIEFFTVQRVYGDKTYYKGVKWMPPASILRYSEGNLSISSYWKGVYNPEQRSLDDYAEELAALLKQAVKRITSDTERVGMLLSGGLDSRAILAATESEMKCFTFGDYKNPEYLAAKKVADVRGFESVFMLRSPDHYYPLIETGTQLSSGMQPFNHIHHSVGFLQRFREDCDVLLHMNPIEMMFRGTNLSYAPTKLGKTVDFNLLMEDVENKILHRKGNRFEDRPPELFNSRYSSLVGDVLRNTSKQIVREASDSCEAPQDFFLWPDIYYLARYPSYLWLNGLRSGITERTVMFDRDLLDLHYRIPSSNRSDDRLWIRTLEILNPAVAGATNANSGISPLTSAPIKSIHRGSKFFIHHLHSRLASILDRQSSGATPGGSTNETYHHSPTSWPDFNMLIRENKKIRDKIAGVLDDPEALDPGVFDIDTLQSRFQAHLEGRESNRFNLFLAVTFGRWHKQYPTSGLPESL